MTTPPDIRSRIASLRNEIRHHDYLYYVKDRPVVSDTEYDRLFRALQELEATYPELVTADSPTQRVGGHPQAELQKVAHERPMLSLDSITSVEEVYAFDKRVKRDLDLDRVDYTAEPKFDGLSIELVYHEGRFVRGATRGDGTIGEDVTVNLRTLRSVPLQLRSEAEPPTHLAVRGEVYMRLDDFQALNRRITERGKRPLPIRVTRQPVLCDNWIPARRLSARWSSPVTRSWFNPEDLPPPIGTNSTLWQNGVYRSRFNDDAARPSMKLSRFTERWKLTGMPCRSRSTAWL